MLFMLCNEMELYLSVKLMVNELFKGYFVTFCKKNIINCYKIINFWLMLQNYHFLDHLMKKSGYQKVIFVVF